LDDIDNIGGSVFYHDNSQGTWVNPTIQGDVTNYNALQINGNVTFSQTSGDQFISGKLRYIPTGNAPTGTLDPSSGSGAGWITYDTGWLYVNVQYPEPSGWLRTRLYPWGNETNQYGPDGNH
jgi:hypothetical protein